MDTNNSLTIKETTTLEKRTLCFGCHYLDIPEICKLADKLWDMTSRGEITPEELQKRIDQAEKDYLAGRFGDRKNVKLPEKKSKPLLEGEK